MAARHLSAMPRTGAPPMIGETPTTVFARTAAAMPGTARMVPTLTTGLDGGNRTTSASPMASSTPGAGAASSAPARTKPSAGPAAGQRPPPSREGDGAPARVTQDHLGLDAVIGHREQPDAGLPAVAEDPGGRGQGEAGAEDAGPVEMGGDVPVAQAEPVRPGAVGGQFRQDGVG